MLGQGTIFIRSLRHRDVEWLALDHTSLWLSWVLYLGDISPRPPRIPMLTAAHSILGAVFSLSCFLQTPLSEISPAISYQAPDSRSL